MPLATMTGSPRCMSRETQTGSSVRLPPVSDTLKAATPPSFVTGVLVIGNLNCECCGPQKGATTKREAVAASSQVESAPQLPESWKSASSLQNNGVLYSGVW